MNLGDEINVDKILAKVGLPCFVKPNKSGSSFGISKVKTKEEFLPAIENAYKEDDEIIIESFLDGTEVSVGVINYKGNITVLPITEIVSENDFLITKQNIWENLKKLRQLNFGRTKSKNRNGC